MARFVNYDAIAPGYGRRYEQNEYGGVEQALLKFVGKGNAISVLEVGCGTGFWLGVLADRGLSVAGLDASKEMLRQAQAHLLNTPLVYGCAEALPWRDGAFDRVFCINSFHHFEGKQVFLAEALEHLDLAINECRDMKMQPSLERALRHKEIPGV